jgi:phage baseplate assembly protein gpV
VETTKVNVVPSFYGTSPIGLNTRYDGQAFTNNLLRFGEVKKITKPSDKDSRSGKFYEYDVLVQHRENDTADTRWYYSCICANDLGGFADKVERTLRIGQTENPTLTKGFGSKVLILCINGSQHEAIIVSGLRDDTDADNESLGHHYTFQFNGCSVRVEDDGSYTVSVEGRTRADGKPSDDRVDGGGSFIKIDANGNITLATQEGKQSVTVDNQDGTIKVNADKDLVIDGSQIHVGVGANEPAVLGNQLASLLTQILGLCASIAGGLPDPQMGMALSLQANLLAQTIQPILSQTVKVTA